MEDDILLLSRLRDGDISAIEVLYIRYAPQVKSFVSAIFKNDADTEDFIQDLFLKIWENRETVARAESFRSYLYSMVKNMVYNKIKHKRVHDRYMNSSLRPQHYEPEERIQTKDLLRHINEELERLTEQQSTIYRLSREEGLTYKEISSRLNISPKTVQYHISNVLAKLRKLK